MAQRYVKAAKLDERGPSPRHLLLDPLLCDALFKGSIKKGSPYPTTLDKAELRDRVLARMQAQTRVSRGQYMVGSVTCCGCYGMRCCPCIP